MTFVKIKYSKNELSLLRDIIDYKKKGILSTNSANDTTKYISVRSDKIIGGHSIKALQSLTSDREKEKKAEILKEKIINIASKLFIFRGLNHNQIEHLMVTVKFEKFKKNSLIFRKGDKSKKLFFLISGEVDSSSKSKINHFLNIKSYLLDDNFKCNIISRSDKTEVFSFILNESFHSKYPEIYKRLYLNISKYLLDEIYKMESK